MQPITYLCSMVILYNTTSVTDLWFCAFFKVKKRVSLLMKIPVLLFHKPLPPFFLLLSEPCVMPMERVLARGIGRWEIGHLCCQFPGGTSHQEDSPLCASFPLTPKSSNDAAYQVSAMKVRNLEHWKLHPSGTTNYGLILVEVKHLSPRRIFWGGGKAFEY